MIVERPATEHTRHFIHVFIFMFIWPTRFVVRLLAPLVHVSQHVKQAQVIRQQAGDWPGSVFVVSQTPGVLDQETLP